MATSQDFVNWVCGDQLNNQFLKYVLIAERESLNMFSMGTTHQTIYFPEVKAFHIALPPKAEQDAIASLLSGLDDKIELNRRMNATLEAMAQAIFRDWFVDFGPVRRKLDGATDPVAILGGLVTDPEQAARTAALFPESFGDDGLPEGWNVMPIGEASEIVGGATPKTAEEAYWNKRQHLWATPKDLSKSDDLFLSATDRMINDAGLEKIGSGLSPAGSVLMSSRAPIGYLAIANAPVAVNQGFVVLRPTNLVPTEYAYFWCVANMKVIKTNANGSTFQEISKKNFRPLPIIIPSAELTSEYRDLVGLLMEVIRRKEAENRTLAETRDYLLPRLMSGQVRVAGAEKPVEAVA